MALSGECTEVWGPYRDHQNAFRVLSAPLPGPSETLVALEKQHAERLLDFERLDEAWPKERGL